MNIARVCVVVPCYNEEKGLDFDEYNRFLKTHADIVICFVNDGSTDDTLSVLRSIELANPDNSFTVNLQKNQGKAEAVRSGILHCLNHYTPEFIGYLDADLSASLNEFLAMEKYMTGTVGFCFGSRIMRIGSIIVRKAHRFLIGRLVATFISSVLQLNVYDTQCGCKLFRSDVAERIFRKKLISSWLFDVELFFRMTLIFGKEKSLEMMYEIPLGKWIEKGDSKVRFSYGFKLWYDLLIIRNEYKRNSAKFV